jgi:thymidylate kinase
MKIIEVVGLAGAGKSTLVNPLVYDRADSYGRYRLRRAENLAGLLKSAVASKSLILRNLLSRPTRNPAQVILQFEASIDDLKKLKDDPSEKLLVLDQGPIFGYVSMLLYELKEDRSGKFTLRFQNKLKEFALLIDGIIYLDSPIEELIDRVDSRLSDHKFDHFRRQEKIDFYGEYNTKYVELIEMFNRDYQTPICRINTLKCSIFATKEIAEKFISSL